MKNVATELDSAGYRKFGLVTGSILAVLFGLVLPWLFNFNYPVWPWVVAGVLIIMALLIPLRLGPVYKIWMKFGFVMNWINTRLILGILFYGIFLPVGFLLKLLGKVPIPKDFNKQVESYRKLSQQSEKENMERPY